MKINKLPIKGAFHIENSNITDSRGSFMRVFCQKELSLILGKRKIEQVNISSTKLKGTIRGMHVQKKPKSEMKIIHCIKGKVFDVIIDLRTNSKTYLKWYSLILSKRKNNTLIIPEGCAHGFQALENGSSLIYFHTEFYSPKQELGFHYKDPVFDIDWPLAVNSISKKDKSYKFINIKKPNALQTL